MTGCKHDRDPADWNSMRYHRLDNYIDYLIIHMCAAKEVMPSVAIWQQFGSLTLVQPHAGTASRW